MIRYTVSFRNGNYSMYQFFYTRRLLAAAAVYALMVVLKRSDVSLDVEVV